MLRTRARFLLEFKHIHNRNVTTKRCAHSSSRHGMEAVIGLEIHAQIAAASKLFSGASTQFAAPVNQQVACLDAALPGTLPVLNRACVEAGVKTALALNCHINLVSYFDRKHYFYADLPAGYQITQQRQALGVGGWLPYMVRIKGSEYAEKRVRITQLQLEQDSGKSVHDEEAGVSLIDLNRAGVGLMEIVTEPDFRSGEEAAAFVRELQMILLKLNTCDGKMEEGSLRVDASVSVHRPGEPLGVRSEVKNINSVRWVANAIEYEIGRQLALVERGDTVENDTRTYNPNTKKTVAMRDKEKLHDYRFMPEPNLPPLRVYRRSDNALVESAEIEDDHPVYIDDMLLPVLPSDQRKRLMEEHGLRTDYAVIIVNEPGLYEYFEAVLSESGLPADSVANFLINRLITLLTQHKLGFEDCPLPSTYVAEVLQLAAERAISNKHAFQIVELLLAENCTRRPRQIVTEEAMELITDEAVILEHIQQALTNTPPKVVRQAQKGKDRPFRTLCKIVMTACGQRVDSQQLERMMRDSLKDYNT